MEIEKLVELASSEERGVSLAVVAVVDGELYFDVVKEPRTLAACTSMMGAMSLLGHELQATARSMI